MCNSRDIVNSDVVYDPVLELRSISISRENDDDSNTTASINHPNSFVRDPSRLSITGLEENEPETSFSSQSANYDSRYNIQFLMQWLLSNIT